MPLVGVVEAGHRAGTVAISSPAVALALTGALATVGFSRVQGLVLLAGAVVAARIVGTLVVALGPVEVARYARVVGCHYAPVEVRAGSMRHRVVAPVPSSAVSPRVSDSSAKGAASVVAARTVALET